MGQEAAKENSSFCLALGDNFYEAGIATDCHDERFQHTYVGAGGWGGQCDMGFKPSHHVLPRRARVGRYSVTHSARPPSHFTVVFSYKTASSHRATYGHSSIVYGVKYTKYYFSWPHLRIHLHVLLAIWRHTQQGDGAARLRRTTALY